MQALAFHDARAFGRRQIAANADDLSIAHQHGAILNLRARHRMNGGSPKQEAVIIGSRERQRD